MENCENMRPVAALVNASNQGYARVILDNSSIEYFLANISSIKMQADRTQTWQVLHDHVRMCKVSPADFLKCVIEHISNESEQRTLSMIIAKTAYVMANFLEQDQKEALSEQLFNVLLKHCLNQQSQSLRNLLINNLLGFATSQAQKAMLHEFLQSKQIKDAESGTTHDLNKSQRYRIIVQIFSDKEVPMAEKEELLKAEMEIAYSDVDELQKLACHASLPGDEDKQALWAQYVNKEGFSQQQFEYSASQFYNTSDKEQCMKYAALFFDVIYDVKDKYHRDYGGAFFVNLSPAFLGQQEHLAQFESIQQKVLEQKPDDSHFLKLLSDEIEKMQEIVNIRETWK